MTKTQCATEFPEHFTHRMVFRQVASIYDPLGLLLPVTLKTKLLIRSLVTKEIKSAKNRLITSDEPLNDESVREWRDFVISLFKAENVIYKMH